MPKVHILINLLLVFAFPQLILGTGCSLSERCIGRHQICSINSCICKDGYTKGSNGTCIDESVGDVPKTFYTILVAVFALLIVLFLVIIITVILMMKKKTYNLELESQRSKERYQMTTLKHKPSIRHILGEYNEPKYSHYDDEDSNIQEDFQILAESLKTDAPIFLKMINEVKRKLDLLDDRNTAQAMEYKALIRDLSRVLQILNKNPTKLDMPSDGVSLLLWAENALKRFEYEELQNPIKDREKFGECSSTMPDGVL